MERRRKEGGRGEKARTQMRGVKEFVWKVLYRRWARRLLGDESVSGKKGKCGKEG